MRLFVDLDGVLADFDAHYQSIFGVKLDRNGDEPPDMWSNVRTQASWFDQLPMMPGASEFWTALKPYRPTLLSGYNPNEVPGGDLQKRRWVDQHLGADVPLITCRSKFKCLHGEPGDILIDDWAKYQDLWTAMGGHFVLHTSPAESLAAVEALVKE